VNRRLFAEEVSAFGSRAYLSLPTAHFDSPIGRSHDRAAQCPPRTKRAARVSEKDPATPGARTNYLGRPAVPIPTMNLLGRAACLVGACRNEPALTAPGADATPVPAETPASNSSPSGLAIRHDDPMSWTVHELVPMPRTIDEAYEVIKAPIRIQIAHFLADHPASRIGEILTAIGSERMTVRNHLEALEKVGIVIASVPAGERRALWVRYSLNHSRWTEMLIRIINYLPAQPQD